MGTTIKVSDRVKADLDEIKDVEEHTSYDSVIRTLVAAYECDDE